MKKVLSIILCLCVLLSFTPVISFAADDTFKATVVSDIHYSDLSKLPVMPRNTVSDDFSHVVANGLMLAESDAIFTAFLTKAAKDESNFLFVCGDITDSGSLTETAAAIAKLEAFEAETGKTVFVINGNHDILTFNATTFKTLYGNLGYDKAIAIDPDSCSYTADLNDTYRLIAIDSCKPNSNEDNFSEATLKWVEAQVKAAKEDGKYLVAITHHNIMEHFGNQSRFLKTSVVSPSKNIPQKLADWGIKFVFSGHSHDNDISVHVTEKDNRMYNIVTPALSLYPASYRTAAFDKSVTVNTVKLSGINTALLPPGFSEAALSLMETDWNAYTKKSFTVGISAVLNNYLKPAYLKRLLGINEAEAPELAAAIDTITPRIVEAIDMPLYSAEGVTALEDIAKAHDVSFDKTNYKTAREYILDIAAAHFAGGNMNIEPQLSSISNILASIITYAIEPIDDATYIRLIKTMIKKVLPDSTITDNIIDNMPAGERYPVISVASSLLMTVVIRPITIDQEPADHNATMPGYGKTASFFSKLIELFRNFIQKITSLFKTLFSFYNA